MNILKSMDSIQRRLLPVASAGGGALRVWGRCVLAVLLMVLALAGREAHAAWAEITWDLGASGALTFNIDQTLNIGGKCTGGFLEVRNYLDWKIEAESDGKNLGGARGGDGPYMNGFKKEHPLYDTGYIPDKSYKFTLECGASISGEIKRRTFKINPLDATYNITANNDNSFHVTGEFKNGASGIAVYKKVGNKLDGEIIGTAKKGATSSYKFDTDPLDEGKHDLTVYVTYGKYSRALGTVPVQTKPVVELRGVPEYTKQLDFTMSGTARSPGEITRVWLQWKKDGISSNLNEDLIPIKWAADVQVSPKIHEIDAPEGKYSFRLKAEDDKVQEGYSHEMTTTVDRTAPTIELQSPAENSFVGVIPPIEVTVDGTGSPVDDVQMCAYSRGEQCASWKKDAKKIKRINDNKGTYSHNTLFANVDPGEVTVAVWAKDKAGNASYKYFSYVKAPLPTVSISTSPTPTVNRKITINGKAHSDAGLKGIQLTWRKDGGPSSNPVIPLKFTAGTDADVTHSFDASADGKYFFRVSATAQDGQSGISDEVSVVVDNAQPTIEILSPLDGTYHEKSLPVMVNTAHAGSGIRHVHLLVRNGSDIKSPACTSWMDGVHVQGGRYSVDLPLDNCPAGPITVEAYVENDAGIGGDRKFGHYFKTALAADALSASLEFVDTAGKAVQPLFYEKTLHTLRAKIAPKNIAISGMTVAYELPPGMKGNGAPVLRDGVADAALKQKLEMQLAGWRQNGGNLFDGVDLPSTASLTVDIPVIVEGEPPTPKISGAQQFTDFKVIGSNIQGEMTAQTSWTPNWLRQPKDEDAPVSAAFDLSSPPDIQIFRELSGGYDTAHPEKWNRNALHCAGANQECTDDAGSGYTSIKLRFEKSGSGQAVYLYLKGERQRTPHAGGALLKTALGSSDNQGADAEVRFSVWLPKEELARIPKGGTWRADLNMALRDYKNSALAAFTSLITLTVADSTNMALTPPQIQLLPGSHDDKDQSSGYSAGDELTHRISYQAARDLNDVQIDYALPAGLTAAKDAKAAPAFAKESSIQGDLLMDENWNGALLKKGVSMKKGETLIIDVRLRVAPGREVQIKSSVVAIANGYDDMTSNEIMLTVQRKFPVSQALMLTLDMIAPQPGQSGRPAEDAAVAQKEPFIYRVVLTAKQQAVDNVSLRYRLPGGLRRTGEAVRIEGAAAAALNPGWDGDKDDGLLASGTPLQPLQAITIDIPVEVKESVGDGVSVRSEVSAESVNLSDALTVTHKVNVRQGSKPGGDRVAIEKETKTAKAVKPGDTIKYLIRVSNRTDKTVRKLLIRDHAPDDTALVESSCGDLAPDVCRTFSLSDKELADGPITHDALCADPGRQSVPKGRQVIWCINGDLAPRTDYVVDYTVKVNGGAAPP